MESLIPWLFGAGFALLGIVGAFLRGKSTGKTEAREAVATKVNQQAAQAAKVKNDVQSKVDRLPDGDAAAELKRKWMRQPPAGGR